MKRSKFSQDLLVISVLTVMTTLFWIVLDTYRAFTKKEIPKILQEQLEPLNPEIDIQTLDDLSKRTMFKKEEIPLPRGDQTPESTVSGEIE